MRPHNQIESHAVRYEIQRYRYAVDGRVPNGGCHDVGNLFVILSAEYCGEYLDEVALADQQEKYGQLHLGLLNLPIGGRVVTQLLREDPAHLVEDEGVEEADQKCDQVELSLA